jgi:hypothetical protein
MLSLILMKRATITLNDELERAVDAYLRDQKARPSLTAVVQTALRRYLSEPGYVRPAKRLRITPARRGSGRKDVSERHDRYVSAR